MIWWIPDLLREKPSWWPSQPQYRLWWGHKTRGTALKALETCGNRFWRWPQRPGQWGKIECICTLPTYKKIVLWIKPLEFLKVWCRSLMITFFTSKRPNGCHVLRYFDEVLFVLLEPNLLSHLTPSSFKTIFSIFFEVTFGLIIFFSDTFPVRITTCITWDISRLKRN